MRNLLISNLIAIIAVSLVGIQSNSNYIDNPFEFNRSTSKDEVLMQSRDTFPPDTTDSCYFKSYFFVDNDSLNCLQFEKECIDTCLCVYIEFKDGSSVNQNIQIQADGLIKMCFNKDIYTWSILGVECSKCGIGKNEKNHSPTLDNFELPILYPNPTKNTLTIGKLKSFNDLTLILTDVNGQRVFESKINSSTVDISKAGIGLFIAELFQNNKRILVQKIINN